MNELVRKSPFGHVALGAKIRDLPLTFDRKMKIEALYERWVPIPANEADDMQHVHGRFAARLGARLRLCLGFGEPLRHGGVLARQFQEPPPV